MNYRKPLTVTALVLFFGSYAAFGQLKPQELVQKHLASLGTPQVLASMHSRVVEAPALYKVLVGGSGSLEGKGVIASQGEKARFLMKVNTVEYRGEQFISDGKHTSVAGTYSDKSRSELGDFVLTQDGVLRSGLLGGALSTAWPLLEEDMWRGKLGSVDTKSVDGRDLLRVQYKPKGAGDMDVQLYFDPKTYQHVMTIYKVTIAVTIGLGGELSSTGRQESRYRLEERFGDFQTADGLTLPSHYDLRFTEETAAGFTKSVEWEFSQMRIMNNISLDPRNFEVK
jgi:hypothetical protein